MPDQSREPSLTQARINYFKTAPDGFAAMRGLESYVRHSGIEHSLLELVKMRASQINGWNRLSIAFRSVAGTYQPARSAAPA